MPYIKYYTQKEEHNLTHIGYHSIPKYNITHMNETASTVALREFVTEAVKGPAY